MMTKNQLLIKKYKVALIFIVSIIISSCSSIFRQPTCEERCEFNKRDCLESARQDSINFSFFMRHHGNFVPYSWTKKCEDDAQTCKKGCQSVDGK